MHLPLSLQKKLSILFPEQKERDAFIIETIEKAIEHNTSSNAETNIVVGGTLHLFSDGGSRGNPGRAAIGCVLIDPHTGTILKEHGVTIGIETNNIAEYKALIEGLRIAQNYHPNALICHLDSELVVKQLKGEYKVKMPSFQPLIAEIVTLCKHFPSVSFVAIPRARNSHADRLVNEALDGRR